jgi:hypothetical protein
MFNIIACLSERVGVRQPLVFPHKQIGSGLCQHGIIFNEAPVLFTTGQYFIKITVHILYKTFVN